MVIGLTIIGWALAVWNLYRLPNEWTHRGVATGILFIIYIILCALITLTRFFPWYKPQDRGAGIEEHFEKTLVPTSYIMVVINAVFIFWKNAWPLVLAGMPLLLVIISVNFILIYFHRRDKNPTPPSYFARSLYKITESDQ